MIRHRRYAIRVAKNGIYRLLYKNKSRKYLFLLAPTHSGSTLFSEVLASSNNISPNNEKHTREGQLLPTVRNIMFDHRKQWDENLDFDWCYIKSEWLKYWDHRKPIFFEKSPPNLLRAKSIEQAFWPSYFIVYVRDPYAHAESFIRKNKFSPTFAAEFIVNALNYQKQNYEYLSNSIIVKYEDLVDNPKKVFQRVISFIPEIDKIETNESYNAHNYLNKNLPLVNLNQSKIEKLKTLEIKEMNMVYIKHKALISWFNYELR